MSNPHSAKRPTPPAREYPDADTDIEDSDIEDSDSEDNRSSGCTSDDRLIDSAWREDCFNTAEDAEEADLCGVFGADDEANFDDLD
jgi:hypothetical protein